MSRFLPVLPSFRRLARSRFGADAPGFFHEDLQFLPPALPKNHRPIVLDAADDCDLARAKRATPHDPSDTAIPLVRVLVVLVFCLR